MASVPSRSSGIYDHRFPIASPPSSTFDEPPGFSRSIGSIQFHDAADGLERPTVGCKSGERRQWARGIAGGRLALQGGVAAGEAKGVTHCLTHVSH
jgi:hypothetical protein